MRDIKTITALVSIFSIIILSACVVSASVTPQRHDGSVWDALHRLSENTSTHPSEVFRSRQVLSSECIYGMVSYTHTDQYLINGGMV